MTDEPKQSEATAGAGELLRAQRERQGMSPQEAAAGLNLRPGIIEALEADRYDLLPPRTFVRGYLRAYAKLLGLKEYDVLAAFELQQPEPEAEQIRRAAGRDQRPRGGGLKWLVLAIALALIAYVVYQSYYQPRQESAGAPPAVEDAQPQQAEQQAAPFSGREGAAATAPEAEESRESAISESGATAETEDAAELQPAPDQAAAANSETAAVESPSAGPANVAAAVPQPPQPPVAAPVTRAQLALEINEESWVEVRDASGGQVYAGLVQGPRTLELSGRPPLRLVIGNAQNARLYYAGELVPLAPHTRREVARLTLPLSQ